MLKHYTPKVLFLNFIYPTSWLFPHIDLKKVCTSIKHSVAKFPLISSIQYNLAFITSFFAQSRNFYENNMILWYYQIRPKVVWKMQGAGIDGYYSPNKGKNITITKIKSLLFFHAMYYSRNHVIPHLVIAAILNVILNLSQRWKTTLTCQSNSPNTTANIRYSYLLRIWFQVEFCFKWRPSWPPPSIFQPCESNLWMLHVNRLYY